jgi:hypothetical protein
VKRKKNEERRFGGERTEKHRQRREEKKREEERDRERKKEREREKERKKENLIEKALCAFDLLFTLFPSNFLFFFVQLLVLILGNREERGEREREG